MRITVAIIFIPLIIYISYRGGDILAIMILVFSALGITEYLAAQEINTSSLTFWLSGLAVMAMVTFAIYSSFKWSAAIFILYFLMLGMVVSLKRGDPKVMFPQVTSLTWGVAYLGFLYPFVYLIRAISPDKGGDWLLLLFGTIWLSDTMAMWVGKGIGKRKLAPTVSPGKTIEGFIAGIAGGVFAGGIMYYWRLDVVPYTIIFVISFAISVVGQLGDLAESLWKRSIGIKDSSKIIPGHGGILDRFDSLLFAAPILYGFLRFIVYR